MNGTSSLGAKIRQLRLDAKLSQRDLAARVERHLTGNDPKASFDFTYLSKIENDKLVPSAVALIAIAAVLEANSDELLALAGKAPPDVGDMLQKSEGARTFFRSAMTKGLTESEWQKLLEDLKTKRKK